MLPQFGTAVRKKKLVAAVVADHGAPDQGAVDAAWLVLEAANDLGDHAAIEACRRVIDAELTGAAARTADVDLVLGYFR